MPASSRRAWDPRPLQTAVQAPHLTVSPRVGIDLCEDGGGEEFLHGLTTDGRIFTFAQNNVTLRGERNAISGDFTTAEWAPADGQRALWARPQIAGCSHLDSWR